MRRFDPVYFKSWKGIADAFLKYYHSQKKIYMRRFDIMTFKQTHDENLIPAIDRFLKLLRDCPFHNLSDCVLLHIFYGGLNDSSRINLDIRCDGSFYDKPFEESWNLLKKMLDNSYQWQGDTMCKENFIPTEFDNVINEYLKDKNSSREIPYGGTIVRNVLYKAIPFISSHFNHIKTAATNNGEQPCTVTPISSTCCTIEAGKKCKTRKPKAK